MIGKLVNYKLTSGDAATGNRDRRDAGVKDVADVAEGTVVPMMVTKVNGPTNLDGVAMLEGNVSVLVQSASEGDGPGNWRA